MPDQHIQEVAELRRTLAREVRARQAAERIVVLVRSQRDEVRTDLLRLQAEKSDTVLESTLRRAEERIAEVDRELTRTDRRRLAAEAELNRLKLQLLQPPAQAAPAEVTKPAVGLRIVSGDEGLEAATIGAPCLVCDGCGRVANDEGRTPWTAWANLPPGADLAVRMGIVKPMPCGACGGTGKARP